jgi:hypothetical protein
MKQKGVVLNTKPTWRSRTCTVGENHPPNKCRHDQRFQPGDDAQRGFMPQPDSPRQREHRSPDSIQLIVAQRRKVTEILLTLRI